MRYIYKSFTEDGSAMDTDCKQPQTTPVSYQCVLSTLTAVCYQESVIHEVIPLLVEHVQHLYDGKKSVVLNLSRLFQFIPGLIIVNATSVWASHLPGDGLDTHVVVFHWHHPRHFYQVAQTIFPYPKAQHRQWYVSKIDLFYLSAIIVC